MREWIRRSGIQLAVPFEEKRILKWERPWIVQPKLDGDRCRALFDSDGVKLVSSEEHLLRTVPHIEEQLRGLDLPRCVAKELDGELYIHGVPQNVIHGIVSSQRIDLHPEYKKVEYHIYDIPSHHEQEYRIGLLAQEFKNWFADCSSIKYVPFYLIDTLEELYDLLEFLHSDKRFEGFIVRNRGVGYYRNRSAKVMMKFKPCREDIYLIKDVKEAIDKDGFPKGMIGSFICCSPPKPEIFSIGAGRLTHEQRIHLWKFRTKLPGMKIRVSYQHLTAKNGVPRSGVALEVWVK